MSENDSVEDVDHEFLVSHQGESVVEEKDGKKKVRFSVPPFMQGHNFTVDLTSTPSTETPQGPFRFEYVMGTEFAIHENDEPSPDFEIGYSHLRLAQDFGEVSVNLTYADTKTPTQLREAKLAFIEPGGSLRRIIVESSEQSLSVAVRHLNQFVADLLDSLVFVKAVPLTVRHIEIHSLEGGPKFHRRYLTLPYRPRLMTIADVRDAQTVPGRLKPALRLFREGISSSRPPYRLLCLYRIREVLDEVSQRNTQEVLARGEQPVRPRRQLPDNELTREYFANYIGKKPGAFLDHVRSEYRLPIAHANLDAFFKLVLDPANVRTDHRIDYTNAVLEPVVAEMIRDESDFMRRFGLSEPLQSIEETHEST